MRKIPFTVQIPKEDRDKDLETKLEQELSGILAWAVRGCLAWQAKHDLEEPDAVVSATQAYRIEMDSLGRFLDECCVEGDPEMVKVKAPLLGRTYHAWCARTGEDTLTNSAFITALEKRNFRRKRGTGNQYYWHGVGLMSIDDERVNTDDKRER